MQSVADEKWLSFEFLDALSQPHGHQTHAVTKKQDPTAKRLDRIQDP